MIRNALYISAFSVMALGLTGCESMKQMRDSISAIDFPYFGAPKTEETDVATAQKMSADDTGILATNTEGCPQVAVVEDLKNLTQFETPAKPTPGSKISSITLSGIKSSCAVTEKTVAVDIGLRFDGQLGPQADEWKSQSRSFAYPYFIAVTTQSGEIISKEVFAATISYDKAEKALTQEESIRQVIPLRDGKAASSYEILVGFQLTEDELNYSRMMESKPAEKAQPKKKATKPKAKKATEKPVEVTPPETTATETPVEAPVTEVTPTPISSVPTTENAVIETPVEQPIPTTTDGSVSAAPTSTEMKEESSAPVTAPTPADTVPAPTMTVPTAPAVNGNVQGTATPTPAVNPYAPPATQVISIKPDGSVVKN